MKKCISLLLLSCLLTACHTGKEAALNDLRSLTSQIEQNAYDYEFKDWVKVQKKFEKIDDRLRRYDYSTSEAHEIGELKGKSLTCIAKGILSKAGNKVLDAASQIKGIIDGIQKAITP